MNTRKIMAIYAHPADPITDCGGALALHVQNGDDVVIVALTHGARIHPNKFAEEWRKENPDAALIQSSKEEIISVKRRELQEAASILGIQKVIMLEEEDNALTIDESLVHKVAQLIAKERPDTLVLDYPIDPMRVESHTLATVTVMAALKEVGMYLENLDGQAQYHVRQIFMTKLPVFYNQATAVAGRVNDVFIDITPVVALKKQAMNCFKSQGYDGDFTNKLLESNNGEFGRKAGVNFAEGYVRYYSETHSLFPLTEHAMRRDALTAHRDYSKIAIRELD